MTNDTLDFDIARTLLLSSTREEIVDALRANLAPPYVDSSSHDDRPLLNRAYELSPMCDALYRVLLHDASRAMIDYATSPYYSDDDTDYQPACADLIHELACLRANDDYTPLISYLLALVTCDTTLLPDHMRGVGCTHERAIDFALPDVFLPYDDCPHVND